MLAYSHCKFIIYLQQKESFPVEFFCRGLGLEVYSVMLRRYEDWLE